MSGFPILDLLLGLVFVFFILSIISSAVVESIITRGRYRSKVLTRWLLTIFDKKIIQPDGKVLKLGQAIADHCLTTALAKEGESTSFIDAKNFAAALIEKLSYNVDQSGISAITDLNDLLTYIKGGKAVDGTSLLSTELARTLLLFGNEARLLAPDSLVKASVTGGNEISPAKETALPNNIPPADQKNSLQIFREKLEGWFDSSMDRITGELKKKHTRPITFWVGLVVVVSLNVDTIDITKYLYDHKQEAKAFADRAEVAAKVLNTNASSDLQAANHIQIALDSLKSVAPADFPLGWSADWKAVQKKERSLAETIGNHLAGWLATVMAIMLGAPFWFDLLNKVANIRGSGAKPASSTDKQREEAKANT